VVPLPGTALVTSQYSTPAHGEGAGNQALFRVYDRMSNQAMSAASWPAWASSGSA
jgi:2-hydroxy-3-oxopropionate reductase